MSVESEMQEVLLALRRLGDDADEIAAQLRCGDMIGIRCSPSDNPIARYLDREFFEEMFQWRIFGADCVGHTADGEAIFLPVPEPVQQFIDRFDRSEYPDLVVPCERPLEEQLARAFQRYDAHCQSDPNADALWVEWGADALDAFESACQRMAQACHMTTRDASLVMMGTLWDRWS